MSTPLKVDEILAAIRQAKEAETEAKEARIALEETLLDMFKEQAPVEGTMHGIGFSVTYKLNRKVDNDKLFAAYDSLTPNSKKAFRFKAEVDIKQFRALSEMDEVGFASISDFVTTAPAKPTVSLKD